MGPQVGCILVMIEDRQAHVTSNETQIGKERKIDRERLVASDQAGSCLSLGWQSIVLFLIYWHWYWHRRSLYCVHMQSHFSVYQLPVYIIYYYYYYYLPS